MRSVLQQFRNFSIRTKIVCTFGLVLLCISIFNFVYFPLAQKRQVTEALEDKVDTIVSMLAAGMTSALDTGDYELLARVFELVKSDPTVLYVAVVDERGDPLLSFNPHEIHLPSAESYTAKRLFEESEILHGAVPLHIEEGVRGFLLVGYSLVARDEMLAEIRVTGLVIVVSGFILGLLLFSFLSHLITDPIGKLVHTIREIRRTGEHQHVTEEQSTDEVGVLIGAFNDMTAEHEQVEGQLRQAQKMEAVGQLTAGIAHNFNNMLFGILGNIELAQMDSDGETGPYLDDAHQLTLRAADMVRQLMVFSRQTQKLDPVPVDMRSVVIDTLTMCRNTFDPRIEIRQRLAGGLPLTMGDAVQLQQVMFNLCLNARDAVEGRRHDPHVEITADMQTFNAGDAGHLSAHNGRYVMVQVTDNGSGMDAETRQRVFEPFFTTKEAGRGTGLGLSTAYAIVDAHGGWIECDSEPDAGATFSVYLPASEQGPAPASEQGPAPDRQHVARPDPRRGTETILVIDDEEPVRKTVPAVLERAGYSVVTAADGAEGLELFQEQRDRIEFVLLDLSMPDMSGRQVLEKLRAIEPEVRVAYFTGRAPSEGEREEVLTVVEKPVNIHELLSAVRASLES